MAPGRIGSVTECSSLTQSQESWARIPSRFLTPRNARQAVGKGKCGFAVCLAQERKCECKVEETLLLGVLG